MKKRSLDSAVFAVLVVVAFAVSPSAGPAPAHAASLPCFDPVPGVTWMAWTSSRRDDLDRWCASVGPPVMVQAAAKPGNVTRLVVVTWNVHVGGGQVEDFVKAHWTERERTGLVLLLEEAYRSDETVPDALPNDLKVPAAIRPSPRSLDIPRLAQRLNMSAVYVPSMRNGRATESGKREDRGNAILSTEPLGDVRAIALPFGKQRRIAIAATVTPRSSSISPLRVVVTHFDMGSHRVAQAEAFGDRIAEFTDMPMIVGGDFNSPYGLRDKAVQAVGRRIQMEPCGTGGTFTWPLRFNLLALIDFGRLDFIFSTLGSTGLTRECRTIDGWFRSDHRPVMLTLEH